MNICWPWARPRKKTVNQRLNDLLAEDRSEKSELYIEVSKAMAEVMRLESQIRQLQKRSARLRQQAESHEGDAAERFRAEWSHVTGLMTKSQAELEKQQARVERLRALAESAEAETRDFRDEVKEIRWKDAHNRAREALREKGPDLRRKSL